MPGAPRSPPSEFARAVTDRPLPLESGEPVTLRVRMGLNTGLVVVGAIGDNLRMDYIGGRRHDASRGPASAGGRARRNPA